MRTILHRCEHSFLFKLFVNEHTWISISKVIVPASGEGLMSVSVMWFVTNKTKASKSNREIVAFSSMGLCSHPHSSCPRRLWKVEAAAADGVIGGDLRDFCGPSADAIPDCRRSRPPRRIVHEDIIHQRPPWRIPRYTKSAQRGAGNRKRDPFEFLN